MAEGERGSSWNSLEAAKLVMSSATPLAIAAVGWFLADRASLDARRREQNDREAERVAKRAADLQAERLRQSDGEKAAALRLADRAREDALRAEAAVRDDAVRAEALRREDAVRSRDLELARYNKLLGERFSVWGITSPSLGIINARFRKGQERAGDATSPGLDGPTLALLDRCDSSFESALPYLSPDFLLAYRAFSLRVRLAMNRDPVSEADRAGVEAAYMKLMFAASDELGLTSRATGPLARDVDRLRRGRSG